MPPPTPPEFPSTCWSRIREGAARDAGAAGAALEELARAYWAPVHAYLRAALGSRREEAEDLTQGFFAWVLGSGFLGRADPGRGRFRAFVKTALRNFVIDQQREQGAQRRGGTRVHAGLEAAAESQDPEQLTPDQVLDRAWRAELVSRALERVQDELEAGGRPQVFAVFRDYFLEPALDVDYAAVAARHGLSKVDVSNYLSRAKRLYRQHLKVLVQETCQHPDDLDEELHWLFGKARA